MSIYFNMDEQEAGALLWAAYQTAKKQWRSFTGNHKRFIRRKGRKGGGKGKGFGKLSGNGKGTGHFVHEIGFEQSNPIPAYQANARNGNPTDRATGPPMKCHGC
eukprot:5232069-Heterocapsa_arctica.AAC.1